MFSEHSKSQKTENDLIARSKLQKQAELNNMFSILFIHRKENFLNAKG
jgi:hypothetical protein